MKNKTLKSIVVICLLLSVSLNYYQYQNKVDISEMFEEQEKLLKTKVYSLEDEMWDYKDENNNLVLDMESYKYVFDHLLKDRFDIHTIEILKRTYSFESSITTGGETFSISPNGIVYITGDSFSFDARINKPPEFKLQQVNDLLSTYDMLPISRLIYYPLADNFEVSDSSLHLEYNNLEVGEVIKFLPNDMFQDKFGINANRIEIHVVDENNFLKGSDYFPSKLVKNYYTASYAPELEISYDFYKFEDTRKDVLYTSGQDLENITYNVSNGSVYSITPLGISNGYFSIENIILPQMVLLGYEWESVPYSTSITDLDVLISTSAGEFNCIEVTYYYESQEVSKNYYSEGVGLVKYIDDFGSLELNKVTDSDVK